MRGIVVPVSPKQTYTFTQTNGTSTLYVGARTIDAAGARSAVLIARVSGDTALGTGALVDFGVAEVSVTPEDPSVRFVGASTTTRISGATAFPALAVGAIAVPTGCQLAVFMTYTAGSTGSTLTVSIDLVLRAR